MKCRRQLPVINQLATEYEGKVEFVLVDTREDGPTLEAFDVGSYPAYLVFRDGVEEDRLSINFAAWGLEGRLRGMIDDALAQSDEGS